MISRCLTMIESRAAINLLREFLRETAYEQAPEAANNIEHIGKLVFSVMNHGYVWIAYQDQQPVGLLMAITEANLWAPNCYQLRELVWYVKPEHRQGLTAGKLFKEYCRQGDELLNEGKIQGYFTTRMSTTKDVNLERRGFRLTEQTYLKERR